MKRDIRHPDVNMIPRRPTSFLEGFKKRMDGKDPNNGEMPPDSGEDGGVFV
jgi:hypothetical protein